MKNTISAAVLLTMIALLPSCTSKEPKTNNLLLEEPPAIQMEADMLVENKEVANAYSWEGAGSGLGYSLQDKPVSQQVPVSKKKIIKDGTFSILTHDIASSKKNIDALIKKLHAYYDNENMDNNNNQTAYDLKIRIPAASFEEFVSAIENGTDEIKEKNISARDITEEFMDIESRLTNKREYLKKYKELLARAATVKDILAIQENIRVLQEEIESKEGRLKYLDDQVTYSTLQVHLFQPKAFVYKPDPQDKFSERVKKSLGNGWNAVVDFVLGAIKAWPVIILVVAVIFLIRRWVKRRRRK